MVIIQFPDNNIKKFPSGSSSIDIAKSTTAIESAVKRENLSSFIRTLTLDSIAIPR